MAGNGTSGSSPNQLSYPARIRMDDKKNLYIAEAVYPRIRLWSFGNNSGTVIAGTGVIGNATDQLWQPYGLGIDSQSNTIYTCERLNNRVMTFANGTRNGTIVLGGNGPGINQTQLYNPFGIHFDTITNTLLIANTYANNIVRYTNGSNQWTLVAGDINGVVGNTSSTFYNPIHVTLDPMGNMYITDDYNYRIQFFYNGQQNGTTIAGITGVTGSNATTLANLRGATLDNQLNLYVADSYNHRIQKFLRY